MEYRKEIDLLIHEYERQYKALRKAQKELFSMQTKGWDLWERYSIGYYISLGIMLVIGLCIAVAVVIFLRDPSMAEPIAERISLTQGFYIEAIARPEQRFCSFVMNSPIAPVIFFIALTIWLPCRAAVIRVEEEYRLNEEGPSDDWIPYFTANKKLLQRIEKGDIRLVGFNIKKQSFKSDIGLKARVVNGMSYTYGTVTLSSNTVPFMKSVYGSGKPKSETTMIYKSELTDNDKISQWERIPQYTDIELSCMEIQLFPEFTKNAWTYLVLCSCPKEPLADAFEALCRLIVYDILLKKLQKGLQSGYPARIEGDIGKITTADLAPYFTKHDHKDFSYELQEAYEKINVFFEHSDNISVLKEYIHIS